LVILKEKQKSLRIKLRSRKPKKQPEMLNTATWVIWPRFTISLETEKV